MVQTAARFCEEEHGMARLLIIDDEESLCRVLKIAFRKNNHSVETASSGQAAKKKIETRVFDLIISDRPAYGIQLMRWRVFTVALGEVEGTSSYLDPRRRAARKRISQTFASPRFYAPPNLG